MWRYLETLPFGADGIWNELTMGEGYTPLVDVHPGNGDTKAKLDFLMPTSSFKDRGAVMLVSLAVEVGAKRLVIDSSGNSGTAVAAYAARAGLPCEVYMSATTLPKKVAQAKRHGASVVLVDGTRQDAAEAAIARVGQGDAFYASHIYNPIFFEGTKTIAFEIWEQLGMRLPDRVVLPVGNGTLVIGTHLGFDELRRAGLTDTVPQIVAVQAERCAPVAKAFSEGSNELVGVTCLPTVAGGIAISAPPRGRQILEAIRETSGFVVTVTEEQIEQARMSLALLGFFVEPTAAATYAGLRELAEEGMSTVTVFCGGGLKAE